MKTGAKWAIGLGAGIPAVLILIGLIVIIIKFFVKRCRKKAWNDITTLPKHTDSTENGTNHRRFGKRRSSERQPLYGPATNNALEVSDGHISIPIDEHMFPTNENDMNKMNGHQQTLVQIQRDRLNRLKEKENSSKPLIRIDNGTEDIQRTIDQAQKEFDQSVTLAIDKLKCHQNR